MRQTILGFFRRGLVACGFGPLVLAAVYLLLQQQGVTETLTVHEVCLGIISLSALAFIAGGMNIVYQIERLPLMIAILIHGGVLYVSYLITYLVNAWLEWGPIPILVFFRHFCFQLSGNLGRYLRCNQTKYRKAQQHPAAKTAGHRRQINYSTKREAA